LSGPPIASKKPPTLARAWETAGDACTIHDALQKAPGGKKIIAPLSSSEAPTAVDARNQNATDIMAKDRNIPYM